MRTRRRDLPTLTLRPRSGGPDRLSSASDWSIMTVVNAVDADPPHRIGDTSPPGWSDRSPEAAYGPGRLGRTRHLSRPESARGGQASDVWSRVLPRNWRPGDLEDAYRQAWRILRATGLRHDAPCSWVFRVGPRKWWVLNERIGTMVVSGGADGLFRVRLGRGSGRSFLQGGDLPGSDGVIAIDVEQQPSSLIDDFGGEYGALHWALAVVAIGRARLAAVRGARCQLKVSRAILDRPEWAALAAAVAADYPGGGGERLALALLEGELWNGPIDTAVSAYSLGFRAGATLAEQQAAGALRRNEKARNPPKAKLREVIRSILIAAYPAGGTVLPYPLAADLLSEGDTTERGRALMDAGVPTAAGFGRMISEIAKQEGYQVGRRRDC